MVRWVGEWRAAGHLGEGDAGVFEGLGWLCRWICSGLGWRRWSRGAGAGAVGVCLGGSVGLWFGWE